MANCGPNEDGEGVQLAQATSEEAQRGTRRSLESEELEYCLVSEESEIQPALTKLHERSEEHPFLAINCHGEKLSRRGKLSIVSVATHSHTYLFDVVALGAKVFDEGLKELLEDPGREKLMFDCRADSDCLWHLHQVRLANVVDLQLLQFIESCKNETTSHINGYRKCLALYVRNENLTKIRDDGYALMGKVGTGWMQRPLPEKLLKHAAADVLGYFKLYDKMKKALDQSTGAKERLQRGSQRYLDLFREKLDRTYDRSELNSKLPEGVLD